MVGLAAVDYLAAAVAVAFAVVGAGLIVVGGCLWLLEGTLKLGPQGVEATLRAEREQAVLELVQETAPEIKPLAQDLIRAVDPTPDTSRHERENRLRAHMDVRRAQMNATNADAALHELRQTLKQLRESLDEVTR